MSDRMTDERLAEIDTENRMCRAFGDTSFGTYQDELIEALKAERERIEELERALENILTRENGDK